MPDNHLFEYAVIRVVPAVEREEFLNVGVVVYCHTKNFLQMLFRLDKERITAFSAKLDIRELEEYLSAFERICAGGAGSGPIGALPAPARFRWLIATRSTIVQTSKVHPGLCDDPCETLDRLLTQLVL